MYVDRSSQLLRLSGLLLVFAATAGLAAVTPSLNLTEADAGWVYAGLFVGLIALTWLGFGILAEWQGRSHAWMHPPVLFTGYYLFMVGLPGQLAYISPEMLKGLDAMIGYSSVWMAKGMALVTAGILSIWVGYAVGLKTVRPMAMVNGLQRLAPEPRIVMTCYVLIVLARLARIMAVGIDHTTGRSAGGDAVGDGLGVFGQWIALLEGARFVLLAMVALQVFGRRWPQRMLVFTLVVETAFSFTSGTFKPMLWVAVVVGAAALYTGVAFRGKYRWYLVMLALAGVLVVPIGQGLRIYGHLIDTRSPTAVASASWTIAKLTWGAGLDVGWEMFMEKVPGRMSGVAYTPGLILWKTPSQIPHIGVEGFLQIPAYMIPRVIWPSKPVMTQGHWFSVNYLNMPPTTTSKSALTVFGEAYIFTGWGGVVVASLAFGFLLAVLFRNTWSVRLFPVYIALIPAFVDVEGQFTTMVVGIVQAIVVYLLLYYVLGRLSGARPGTAASPFGRPQALVPDAG